MHTAMWLDLEGIVQSKTSCHQRVNKHMQHPLYVCILFCYTKNLKRFAFGVYIGEET